MKYNIGQRVKLITDTNEYERYIILSTKEQVLNSEYLRDKNLKIFNIERIAERNLKTENGFDYIVSKEKVTNKKGVTELEIEFINVFESDIVI